mmetsp:Transcript_2148/g.7489  ORF Transcript_2148/g.7489 Transcript_2148/m.7489 type:complete len:198 (+) Transcript_2148:2-595(+)
MTDVANAVFDGTDAVQLGGETANGEFPVESVRTTAEITRNAEQATNYYAVFSFIRDLSAKPFSMAESVASSVCKNVVDCKASLVLTFSSTGSSAQLISKSRPPVPVVVVTDDPRTAREMALSFGLAAYVVPALGESLAMLPNLVNSALEHAHDKGLVAGSGPVVLVHGVTEPDADDTVTMRILDSPEVKVSRNSITI